MTYLSTTKPHGARKAYAFPNAIIATYPDRTCREFPRWCPCICVARSRDYVAEALRQLRQFLKASKK